MVGRGGGLCAAVMGALDPALPKLSGALERYFGDSPAVELLPGSVSCGRAG